MAIVSAGAIGLGITAVVQSQQAALSEVKAIARSAEALFSSDQQFEALLEAIRGQDRYSSSR
ncbi:MAG: hypothetical protein IGR92_16575 [Leptolyngbyaceae cyanobacterium T60_A2020_046]|nr:hypothetical protein [Leptolyngbyaceae cyanobacterium T60_A2020_046]